MFNPQKPNTTMTDKAKVLKPDPRAFANDYGTYRIKGDEKRTKYILIDGRVDLDDLQWDYLEDDGCRRERGACPQHRCRTLQ